MFMYDDSGVHIANCFIAAEAAPTLPLYWRISRQILFRVFCNLNSRKQP